MVWTDIKILPFGKLVVNRRVLARVNVITNQTNSWTDKARIT